MLNLIFAVIFISFLQSASASSGSPWKRITPVASCADVVIDYQQNENQYNVQITSLTPVGEYIQHVGIIEDINDLSPLQDKIHEITYKQCFSGLTQLELVAQCDENTMSEVAPEVSSEYLSFIESIIKALPELDESCKEVISLLELQEQIPSMDQDLRMRFESVKHPLKLATLFGLAPKSVNEIIDHYKACGGQKKANELVRNIILLEAKNACVFSPPAGPLNFNEVLSIAEDVSKDYNNKGLLDLNSSQDKITKKAVYAFIDKILEKQVSSLLGDDYPTEQITSQLKTKQQLSKIKDKDLMEHVKYYFSQNVPIEFIDTMIPEIANKNFKGILPENLSEEQKNQFMNGTVIPELTSTWNACIQDYKDDIHYDETDRKSVIKHRKSQEKKYCKANPKMCELNGCAKTVNFGTLRSDIKDMNIVQACLFRGINNAVPIVIGKIIESQVASLKESIPFSETSTSEIQRKSELTLKSCTEKSFTKHALMSSNNIEEPLQHISSDLYPKILAKCAKEVEKDLTTEFAIMTVAKTAAVEANYPSEDNYLYFGVEFKPSAIEFAKKTVDESLELCESSQLKRMTLSEISYPICQHVIQVKASHAVIESTLENVMNEANVSSKIQSEIKEKFKACTDDEAQIASDQIGSSVKSSNDAQSYFEQNHGLLNCVKEVIPLAVEAVAKNTINGLEEEVGEQISDLSIFTNMKDELKQNVVSCFEKRLGNIKTWNQFLKLNENNFIENTKTDCTHKTTSLALAKIFPSEIENKIKEYKRGGIVTLTSSQLAQSLNPIKNTRSDSKLEDIIKAHYYNYMGANPGAKTSDYTQAFTAQVQDMVVSNIYDQLFKMRTPQSIEETDLQRLKNALPKQCVAELYKIHQKAFASDDSDEKSSKPKEKSTGLLEIQKILTMGVENAKDTKTFDSLTKTLDSICKDPQRYKDLDDIIDSGVANPWVIAYTWSEVQGNLKDAMVTQCLESFIRKDDDNKTPLPGVNQELVKKICADPQTLTEVQILELINKETNENNLHNLYKMTYKRIKNELQNIENNISLKDFNTYFSKHSDFLEYTYNNLETISDPNVKFDILEKIVEPLFKSPTFKTFSDSFVLNQVTAGIGIVGLSQAQASVKEKMDDLGFPERLISESIVKNSKTALKETWSYENIQSYLGWDVINQDKRDEIKEDLYKLNILPVLKVSSLPEGDEKDKEQVKAKEKSDEFSESITDYVNNYKIFENDKAKMKADLYGTPIRIHPTEPDYYTFIDMVTNEITRSTTEKVKKELGEKVKPYFMRDKKGVKRRGK